MNNESIAKNQSVCECGEILNYRITAFDSNETRICPNCGRHHKVDRDLTDWSKIATKNVKR